MATYDWGSAQFDAESTTSRNAIITDSISVVRAAVGNKVDNFVLQDDVSNKYYPSVTISDAITSCGVVYSSLTGNNNIVDDVILHDIISFIWNEILSDNFITVDLPQFDPNLFVSISDRLVLKEVVSNSHEGYLLIQESLKLLDSTFGSWAKIITDDVITLDAIADRLKFYQAIIDNFINIDTANYNFVANALVSDNIINLDDISIQQLLNEHITDVFGFTGTLVFDGDDYYTFVLNTQNEAISTYTNFNFNSISNNLAAADTGIYELVGADDDSVEIQSRIKTHVMDFGSSIHKQVPYAYIGFSSDGSLVLKAISNERGVKNERWYKCVPPRDADDTSRVKMGRGIKDKYWQFELINSNGCDFDIESIELMPLSLKRRI